MRHGDRIPGTPFFYGELVWMGDLINRGANNARPRTTVVGRVYPRQKIPYVVNPENKEHTLVVAILPEISDRGWSVGPGDEVFPPGVTCRYAWMVKPGHILPFGWFPEDGDEWKHRKRGEAIL